MSAAEIYTVVILFLLTVLIVLIVPEYGSSGAINDESYGFWRTYKTKCVATTPSGPNGTRSVVKECIPNQITNRGCLLDGDQTFTIQVEHEECSVQPLSSKWDLVEISECIIHPSSPFPNIPTIKRDYECATTGINGGLNGCEKFEYTFYGGAEGDGEIPTWNLSSIGDSYSVYTPCINSSSADYSGQWVMLNQSTFNSLDKNVPLDATDIKYRTGPNSIQTYLTDNRCLVNDPSPDYYLNSLKEGTFNNPVGCLADNLLYLPSDQNNPTAPPTADFFGCDPYANDPSRQSVCRFLPPEIITTDNLLRLISLYCVVFPSSTLSMTTANLPVDSSRSQPTLISNTNQYLYFDPSRSLDPIELASFYPERTGCSWEEVVLTTASKLLIAPRNILSSGSGNYVIEGQIGILADSGIPGWLGYNDNNVLSWVQSKFQTSGSGLLSTEAETFRISLSNFQWGNNIGGFTPGSGIQGSMKLTVQTISGGPLYIGEITNGQLTPTQFIFSNFTTYLFKINSDFYSNLNQGCNLHRNVSA